MSSGLEADPISLHTDTVPYSGWEAELQWTPSGTERIFLIWGICNLAVIWKPWGWKWQSLLLLAEIRRKHVFRAGPPRHRNPWFLRCCVGHLSGVLLQVTPPLHASVSLDKKWIKCPRPDIVDPVQWTIMFVLASVFLCNVTAMPCCTAGLMQTQENKERVHISRCVRDWGNKPLL